MRPLLFEAGKLISAEQAERRVLVLENPGLRNQILDHAFALRRHSTGFARRSRAAAPPQQAALRFILEGNGATTTVDGERFEMYPGDMILTPSWQWHDHQNETKEPIVWLDGLDIALVALLDASFMQHANQKEQEVTRPKETSRTLYGANMLPIDDAPASLNSPLMRYPYAEARAALERLKQATAWDPCHGIRMRYAHPKTGSWVMPTIGPANSTGAERLCDRPLSHAPMARSSRWPKGTARAKIGNETFALAPRDVFVCPAWAWRTFEARDDLVLFTFSDRPVQEKLGLWREERGAAQ